jgi:hypothetical protein
VPLLSGHVYGDIADSHKSPSGVTSDERKPHDVVLTVPLSVVARFTIDFHFSKALYSTEIRADDFDGLAISVVRPGRGVVSLRSLEREIDCDLLISDLDVERAIRAVAPGPTEHQEVMLVD